MQETAFNYGESGMTGGSTDVSGVLQLGISVVAITVAVFAAIMAFRLVHKLGGRINQAIRYFILGIACNASAIVWSIFSGHIYLFGDVYFDIHQNLMSLGMVFFIISTLKFSRLIQNV